MPESGWIALVAAIAGAGVGAFGTFLATWIKLKGRRDYYDDVAVKFLISKLGKSGLDWEQIRKHGHNIGLEDDVDIKQLLLLGGAEPTGSTPLIWKQKS